jgi:hypothetical protein
LQLLLVRRKHEEPVRVITNRRTLENGILIYRHSDGCNRKIDSKWQTSPAIQGESVSVAVTRQSTPPQLREKQIEWLRSLLQSYPGSQWGNSEMRGLDTSFAAQTYVETPLENSLLEDIRERRVRLVILCGNAGDGKLLSFNTSRCVSVFKAARLFGPDGIPLQSEATIRFRARQRLFEALQGVHLRGEIHITMRELRAALVYVLFGIHFCDDYHSDLAMDAVPYWDRAFLANSVARQGEVLRELARFDPALETHPQIDRYLLSDPPQDVKMTAPRYSHLTLASARRRAFFEWMVQDNELGSRLIKSTTRGLPQDTQKRDSCEPTCRSGWRCA